MIKIKFDSKTRTKMIKVRVSEEEKILMETKAKNYSYRNLSNYIRDAAIYEKVTNVNWKEVDEVCNAYAKYAKEIRGVVKGIKHLCIFLTQAKQEDIEDLKFKMLTIIKNQKDMIKLIDMKLNFEVWKEINRNK